MRPATSLSPWHRVSFLALTALLGGAGCRHAPGPRDVASAYAWALLENRLDDAAALTRLPPEELPAFQALYADAAVRRTRAQEVRAALDTLEARGPSLVLTEGPDGWRVLETPSEDAPRVVLERFLDRVRAGNWRGAWRLLSLPLRAHYTPEGLERDFQREPRAAERAERARLALEGPVRLTDTGAEFPLDNGGAVRLVREAGEYRVASIE